MAGRAILLLLPVQDWLASFISSPGNGQRVTAGQSTRPFAIAGLIPCVAATLPSPNLDDLRDADAIGRIPVSQGAQTLSSSLCPIPSLCGGLFRVQAPVICHLAAEQWRSFLGHSDLTLVARWEPVPESVPQIFLFFLFVGGTGVWPCNDDANSFAMVPLFVEARLRIDYANLGRCTTLACLKVKQSRPYYSILPTSRSIHYSCQEPLITMNLLIRVRVSCFSLQPSSDLRLGGERLTVAENPRLQSRYFPACQWSFRASSGSNRFQTGYRQPHENSVAICEEAWTLEGYYLLLPPP